MVNHSPRSCNRQPATGNPRRSRAALPSPIPFLPLSSGTHSTGFAALCRKAAFRLTSKYVPRRNARSENSTAFLALYSSPSHVEAGCRNPDGAGATHREGRMPKSPGAAGTGLRGTEQAIGILAAGRPRGLVEATGQAPHKIRNSTHAHAAPATSTKPTLNPEN